MIGVQEKRILVIGGSAAGLKAAITARKMHKEVDIKLIRKDKRALVPCGIPYIFETIGSVEKNFLPDEPLSKNNVDIIVDEVTSIDRDKKTVTAKGGTFGYDKLILAVGSSPVVPPVGGVNLENIHTIQKNAEYLSDLSKKIKSAKDVLVVGGGFIGVEFADELRKAGLNVTIVEMLPHCLQLAHDEEFSVSAEDKLRKAGVNLELNSKVERFTGDKAVEGAVLDNGRKLKCDLVLLAIGSAPNTGLAKGAGLKTSKYGICVDEYMRTNDPDIFATGDCAEKFSFFTKKPTNLRLSSIATREAIIAVTNLYKPVIKNEGVIGAYSTVIGDLRLGGAGLNEHDAKDAGLSYLTGKAATIDKHPGTMPDTKNIQVKLLFDKRKETLIGGQVAGGASAGEVVNIISALIGGRRTVKDIMMFQAATHPANTPSPIAYPIIQAAEEVKYTN